MVVLMVMIMFVVVVMMMTISLFQLLPESVTNMERGRYYRNRLKSSRVQIELRRTSCIINIACVCEGSTRSRKSGSELTAKIIEAIGPETSRWIITIMKHALKPFLFYKIQEIPNKLG